MKKLGAFASIAALSLGLAGCGVAPGEEQTGDGAGEHGQDPEPDAEPDPDPDDEAETEPHDEEFIVAKVREFYAVFADVEIEAINDDVRGYIEAHPDVDPSDGVAAFEGLDDESQQDLVEIYEGHFGEAYRYIETEALSSAQIIAMSSVALSEIAASFDRQPDLLDYFVLEAGDLTLGDDVAAFDADVDLWEPAEGVASPWGVHPSESMTELRHVNGEWLFTEDSITTSFDL